jgi:proline dehydrogenase
METHPALHFGDTRIAFASRTDAQLKKAYWLFRMMHSPTLVKMLTGLAEWSFRLHLPIDWAVRATVFDHFCGGESIAGCEPVIDKLNQFGIGTILDYSVEGKSAEKELDACKAEIIRTIEKAKGDSRIPFSVFKVTGVIRFELLEKVSAQQRLTAAEEAEWHRAKHRVQEICHAAYVAKQPLFIDAEDSWIQDPIDQLVSEMMQQYNREQPLIYNTLQMYRHDRLAHLTNAYQQAQAGGYWYAAKLVRGAYMEKERERAAKMGYPSPIQPDKAATDRDYDQALRFCIDHIDGLAVCSGSHNESSNLLLAQLMAEKGLKNDDYRICFAQLYGMSDHISYNLAHAGYNVAKYVPYAPIRSMMPYLIRRAQENTSIAGQMGRELGLLTKEIKRRKG